MKPYRTIALASVFALAAGAALAADDSSSASSDMMASSAVTTTTSSSSSASASSATADEAAGGGDVLKGDAAYGSYQDNKPGVMRLITPDDLPPPNATESASNAPSVVARPDGAMPQVLDGFKVELVVTGIENPRAIRFAPNGDLFVSNSSAGSVLVYSFENGSAKPASKSTFVSGLKQPYGVAFYPQDDPQWIYIAESDGLRRYPYKAGDTKAEGDGEVLFKDIPPSHHWTRDVVFSPDGKTMYYSVGSGSNIGLDITMKKAPDSGTVAEWAQSHELGVAWGGEEGRAAVLAFDPDGKNRRYFATGLRNCAGMTMQQQTGDVWCVVNGRDELGDNLPPDYATHVEKGAFYGWPWFYIGNHLDPRWQGAAPDLGDKVTVPDVLFQPHSAPLNIAFDPSDAWGAEYQNQGFVAMHGSWNRGKRTGYKVVRLVIGDDGKPTGAYEDFVTGFVTDSGDVWGRPVGVAFSPDGSLFISDDGSGSIWKVSKQ